MREPHPESKSGRGSQGAIRRRGVPDRHSGTTNSSGGLLCPACLAGGLVLHAFPPAIAAARAFQACPACFCYFGRTSDWLSSARKNIPSSTYRNASRRLHRACKIKGGYAAGSEAALGAGGRLLQGFGDFGNLVFVQRFLLEQVLRALFEKVTVIRKDGVVRWKASRMMLDVAASRRSAVASLMDRDLTVELSRNRGRSS